MNVTDDAIVTCSLYDFRKNTKCVKRCTPIKNKKRIIRDEERSFNATFIAPAFTAIEEAIKSPKRTKEIDLKENDSLWIFTCDTRWTICARTNGTIMTKNNRQTIGKNGSCTLVEVNTVNMIGTVIGARREEEIVMSRAKDLFPPITSTISGRDIPAGIVDNRTSANTIVGVTIEAIK